METTANYSIRFPEVEVGVASQAAETLRDTLLDTVADVEVTRVKEDPNTQDFGATLAIILAGPAVVALANGIARWLALRGQSFEVEIERPDGRRVRVKGTGQMGEDQARIVEALTGELR